MLPEWIRIYPSFFLFFSIIPQTPFSLFIHTYKSISKISFRDLKLKNGLLYIHMFLLLILQSNILFSTNLATLSNLFSPVSTVTPLKPLFHSIIPTSLTVSWHICLSCYIYLKKSNQAQNTTFSDCKTIAHNADNFSHKLGVKTDNIHT